MSKPLPDKSCTKKSPSKPSGKLWRSPRSLSLLGSLGGLVLLGITQVAPCQWGDQVECVSQSLIGGPYRDVEITADLAGVAMGYGLALFSFSTPGQLQLISLYGTPGTAEGLLLEGGYAYLASGTAGLQIIDLSVPQAPVCLGFLDTPGYSYELAKADNILYLADGSRGVRIFDVSLPSAPEEISHQALTGYARDVEVAGTLLYIAAESAGLIILSVADPSQPQWVVGYNTAYIAQGVRLIGDRLYLADGPGGMLIFDVSDSANPVILGQWPSSGTAAVREVEVSDTLAFVADDSLGLVVLDVSNPSSPTLVTQYNSAGFPHALALMDTLAFLANDTGGVALVSLAAPESPLLLDTYNHPSDVTSIWVQGDYAYVGRGYLQDITILDISNPEAPDSVNSMELRDDVADVIVLGNQCFSANLGGGIYIYNVANPLNPRLIAHRNTEGQAYDLVPRLPFIYIADGPEGLVTMDLAGDTVWHFPTQDYAKGVVLVGDTAYVCQWSEGIMLINISDPYHQGLVRVYDTPGLARRCAVDGDFIYVADDLAGLTVLWNGTLVSSYDTDGLTSDVKLVNQRAYLADGTGGLLILDVSNPHNPRYLASYPTPGNAQEIFLQDENIYVADQYCLGIYRINPTGVSLIESPDLPQNVSLSSHPNPFNAQVRIVLELATEQWIDLRIFNLSGQEVARLSEGRLPAGEHYFTWEAKAKAAGIYLVRCQSEEGTLREKIALVK